MAKTRDDMKARLDLADAIDVQLAVAWADYEAHEAARVARARSAGRGSGFAVAGSMLVSCLLYGLWLSLRELKAGRSRGSAILSNQ